MATSTSMRRCADARLPAHAAIPAPASSPPAWSRSWSPWQASTAPPRPSCPTTCAASRPRYGSMAKSCSSSRCKLPITHFEDSNPRISQNMAKIVVVTSGKGGVGKTTTSAAFASGLALAGHKTAVIDFDVGLRNLDLIMGCERRVVYDFVNVIQGEATLKQALIKDKRIETLFVLAASQTRDKDALTAEGVQRVLDELAAGGFDFIICDSPAGIEKGAHLAMYFADRAVVVVNPEVSSVRDSDRILGLLSSKTRRAEKGEGPGPQHLLLTRYNPVRVEAGEMMSVGDVEEILGIPVLGVIPESENVLAASNSGVPVIHDAGSIAGQAYADAVARLVGDEVSMRFLDAPKKGFFKRMFGT